jgi:hypothetical protein
MTAVRHIEDLATPVMAAVAEDFATLYPAAPPVTSSVSTRDLSTHGAPPRVTWVPWRDDFDGPQKRTLGGSHAQHALATRRVGVQIVCWAGDITATEDLVECLVRHLLRLAGTGAVGITVSAGSWVEDIGAATAGEGYSLFISYPVDIRAQAATPPARPTVTPVLNTSGSGTPGDGTLDSTELPP